MGGLPPAGWPSWGFSDGMALTTSESRRAVPVTLMRVLAAAGVAAASMTAPTAFGAPAHADEATPRDFWRSAASVAAATVYAPADRALGKVGLGPLDPFNGSLRMVCAADWFVTAEFDAADGAGSLTLTEASGPDCTPDPPGTDPSVVASPTKVTVAGRRLTTLFLGCYTADDSTSGGLSESVCPVAKRNYFAYGTLPAANGGSSTYVNVEAQGLSRGQVRTVLRSLRAVG